VTFLVNSLYIKPNNISLIDTEFSINTIIKLLPALLSLTGSCLAFSYIILAIILLVI